MVCLFPFKYFGHYFEGVNILIKKYTSSSVLPSSRRWRVLYLVNGVARGVMVIVIGNGHGNTSSNPGREWLHLTYH